jgi:hypothetical protein
MEKPIAVIGWGSLIWELEMLAPNVRGMWQIDAGPVLPIEFSRISAKRKRSLVLCIDQMSGHRCTTSLIPSTRLTMLDARRDLARRERAPEGFIGGVCLETRQSFGRPQIAWMIWQWCEKSPYSGAVWTDLHSNYAAERELEFTVDGGIEYLKSLDDEGLDEAVRYIEKAPRGTNTPLRRALASDPWWQEHKARVLGEAG